VLHLPAEGGTPTKTYTTIIRPRGNPGWGLNITLVARTPRHLTFRLARRRIELLSSSNPDVCHAVKIGVSPAERPFDPPKRVKCLSCLGPRTPALVGLAVLGPARLHGSHESLTICVYVQVHLRVGHSAFAVRAHAPATRQGERRQPASSRYARA